MADFTITAPVPFTVDGTKGSYELPRVKDFTVEQMALAKDLDGISDLAEQSRAARAFLYALCPELEQEPLSDMGCFQLFKALVDGSGVELGE